MPCCWAWSRASPEFLPVSSTAPPHPGREPAAGPEHAPGLRRAAARGHPAGAAGVLPDRAGPDGAGAGGPGPGGAGRLAGVAGGGHGAHGGVRLRHPPPEGGRQGPPVGVRRLPAADCGHAGHRQRPGPGGRRGPGSGPGRPVGTPWRSARSRAWAEASACPGADPPSSVGVYRGPGPARLGALQLPAGHPHHPGRGGAGRPPGWSSRSCATSPCRRTWRSPPAAPARC